MSIKKKHTDTDQSTILSLVDSEDAEPQQRRRGIFLLPNFITTIALFSGFYAIVAAMNGKFAHAAVAIWVGMVLDALDGRVARMTKTESEFGLQYDSLSDIVTFGVAPALVVFVWGLLELKQIGWISSFVFVACAALRLARFNTAPPSESFIGLPSPAAAAVIVSAVWIITDPLQVEVGVFSASLMATLTVVIGLLMVSNIEYYSFKGFHVKGRVPFVALLVAAIFAAVLMAEPSWVLFAISIGYAASGPLKWLWQRFFTDNRTTEWFDSIFKRSK